MSYNILLTSLYSAGMGEPLRYYFVTEGEKRVYTDAMLSVEATVKYILSQHKIDEIIVMGRHFTYDAGDEKRVLGVDDGKNFYSSDINELSTYSLFRYRLSQFKDDLRIEQEMVREQLPTEKQAQPETFIRQFYDKKTGGKVHRKFGRFFDQLMTDGDLYEEMKKELFREIPEAKENKLVYLEWIKNYLYTNLKESSKLEILECNENVKIRFVPTVVDEDGRLPVDTLLDLSKEMASEEHGDVYLYLAMNNDDVTDNLVMIGALNILDALYGEKVEVARVCTSTNAYYRLVGRIRDDTESYGMANLVSATKAFLKYGKADMIVDCWEHIASKNEQVEKMIYAMRRIDTGLSLCCIGDIEKGVSDLRELFTHGFDLSGSDYYSKLFILMSEGIKKDYGRLVSDEGEEFIDLVRWAYEKGFYQQCLTIIEAKAPMDFVNRGIFCYCIDEEDKQRVVHLFAEVRAEMKSYDYWKMEDIDHYYLKSHFYFKKPSNNIENQRINAGAMIRFLDSKDPEMVKPYTICEDLQALEDLLFAYLHVGRVRNETNHASDGYEDYSTLFPSQKDISLKLKEIEESIRYFIQSYDRVREKIDGKPVAVVKITPEEVRNASRIIEKNEKNEK